MEKSSLLKTFEQLSLEIFRKTFVDNFCDSKTQNTLRNMVTRYMIVRVLDPLVASGGNNCVVCLGRQREVILLPCSHVCMCADCAREIMSRDKTCPVCRAEIERVAPAFIS